MKHGNNKVTMKISNRRDYKDEKRKTEYSFNEYPTMTIVNH